MKEKPNISKHAFWSYDVDFETLDFNENAHFVIKQITQFGTIEEYNEIIRFYGREKVLEYIDYEFKQIELRKKLFKTPDLGGFTENLIKRLNQRLKEAHESQ